MIQACYRLDLKCPPNFMYSEVKLLEGDGTMEVLYLLVNDFIAKHTVKWGLLGGGSRGYDLERYILVLISSLLSFFFPASLGGAAFSTMPFRHAIPALEPGDHT